MAENLTFRKVRDSENVKLIWCAFV